MKTFTLSLLLIFSFLTSTTAQTTAATESKRFIEVTGSAEANVKPDMIELLFTLKEYKKKGKDLVTLAEIETEFYASLEKFGLSRKDVVLTNNDMYGVDWRTWRRNQRAEYRYKRISVKITKGTNLGELMKEMEKDWLDDVSILRSTNKDELTYRKDVKILAMKMAKEKATYLLAAIGEEPGKVISVEEIERTGTGQTNYSNAVSPTEGFDSIDNTGTMKIRYEIKVKFEIK